MAEKDKKEQHQEATINQYQDVNSIPMPENLKLVKFSEKSAHSSHLQKKKRSIHHKLVTLKEEGQNEIDTIAKD